MEKIIRTLLPSLGISFTGAVLFCCIYNLFIGNSYLDICFLLSLFGYFILIQILDVILGKVPFKTYLGYFLWEAILIYVLLLVIGYFANWYSFTFQSLCPITIYCFTATTLVHYYFYRAAKLEADEINQLLKEQNA